jgi:hypothetical protein
VPFQLLSWTRHGQGKVFRLALRLDRSDENLDVFPMMSARPLPLTRRQGLTAAPAETPPSATAQGPARAIILAVTSLATDTLAGDVFTATELADALRRTDPDIEVRLAAPDMAGRVDTRGARAIICLRHDFRPGIFDPRPGDAPLVYWVRNCFDEFLASDIWHRCDDVWMSSDRECDRFRAVTGLPARLLRIAANTDTFRPGRAVPALASDVCFTGSFWGIPRDLAATLDPGLIEGTFRVFGAGWETHPTFSRFAAGPVGYATLPDIYASTRIVLDDANHVTVNSGSVNSRVFDAIAAGALPITNGLVGAREVFGDLLPTYATAQDLHGAINYWLDHEPERRSRVARLRDLVLAEHSYHHRATDVRRFLSGRQVPGLALLCADGSPSRQWAPRLAEALRRRGLRATICVFDEACDRALALRCNNRLALDPHLRHAADICLIATDTGLKLAGPAMTDRINEPETGWSLPDPAGDPDAAAAIIAARIQQPGPGSMLNGDGPADPAPGGRIAPT